MSEAALCCGTLHLGSNSNATVYAYFEGSRGGPECWTGVVEISCSNLRDQGKTGAVAFSVGSEHQGLLSFSHLSIGSLLLKFCVRGTRCSATTLLRRAKETGLGLKNFGVAPLSTYIFAFTPFISPSSSLNRSWCLSNTRFRPTGLQMVCMW